MKDYAAPGTPVLANMEKPLDSPTTLAKGGMSYKFATGVLLSGELAYNGGITSLTPTNLNPGDPTPQVAGANYREWKVPSSVTANMAIRQNLDSEGFKGAYVMLRVTNLLDAKVYGVMNMDIQGWDANTYIKPTQLPGFGRLVTLQLGWKF